MKRIRNYVASLILGLSLVASTATSGCAVRYYDADHRDYHRWDGNEDRTYHVYWTDRHPREDYRDYNALNADQQRDYWNWRHGRPDEGKRKGKNDNRDRDDRDRR